MQQTARGKAHEARRAPAHEDSVVGGGEEARRAAATGALSACRLSMARAPWDHAAEAGPSQNSLCLEGMFSAFMYKMLPGPGRKGNVIIS